MKCSSPAYTHNISHAGASPGSLHGLEGRGHGATGNPSSRRPCSGWCSCLLLPLRLPDVGTPFVQLRGHGLKRFHSGTSLWHNCTWLEVPRAPSYSAVLAKGRFSLTKQACWTCFLRSSRWDGRRSGCPVSQTPQRSCFFLFLPAGTIVGARRLVFLVGLFPYESRVCINTSNRFAVLGPVQVFITHKYIFLPSSLDRDPVDSDQVYLAVLFIRFLGSWCSRA
ncbi:hypothetical protein BGZ60DRAFT_265603 [Tricladium varicosporioides]|nr:hypothetical protein BGZ60DRAFT_265603 [Hymenoscyphus varicosporioides]